MVLLTPQQKRLQALRITREQNQRNLVRQNEAIRAARILRRSQQNQQNNENQENNELVENIVNDALSSPMEMERLVGLFRENNIRFNDVTFIKKNLRTVPSSITNLTTKNYSGLCQICQMNSTESDDNNFCHVNCESKHVFHCSCIKSWADNKRTCPICRETISTVSVVSITPEMESKLNSFGKNKKLNLNLKQINKDIVFLKKK